MTISVSRGIIRASSSGLIKSVSVMTNTAYFKDSVMLLKESGSTLDVGWHANLTWGLPLASPSEIPTLVRRDGRFYSKEALFLRAILGRVSEGDVYRELRAQCWELVSCCPSITHLDGHHHVHIFPVIRDAVERVAKEFGIRVVRAPHARTVVSMQKGFWGRIITASFTASSPSYWREKGFLSPGNFDGFFLGGGRQLKERWMDVLLHLPDGTTEIMVHPGYLSDGLDGYTAGREKEVTLFEDAEFLKTAQESGIQFISHTDFILNP